MGRSAGISGVGVGVATAGAVLMYAGLRDIPILQVLRQATSGALPKGNTAADGQAGAATTAAQAALNTPAAAGGGSSTVNASVVPGGALPQLAAAALKYQGVPYRLGGTTRAGMDCSGLVQTAFHDIGISAPRTTYTQEPWGALHTITPASAGAGDLIFWPGHVAVYLGGGMVVHAPHPGTVVRTEKASQAGPAGTPATYKRYGATVPKPRTATV